jgi:endonuclease-8
MPEGDTIAYVAAQMRPVLVGAAPDEILTPQPRHRLDRWPQRLSGRSVIEVRTHGKHLFVAFEGELVIHSHLRMTGAWGVYSEGRRWRRSAGRAWLILRSRRHEVVQFDGPVLELLTEGRVRLHQRLAALGPDVLAPQLELHRVLARLRADDQTRSIGDALLDQRNVAGIGNIWKSEGCWQASIDPRRPVSSVSDAEAIAVIEAVRAGMLQSAKSGYLEAAQARVYRRAGRPCPRCGTRIRLLSQGDDNRTTFWCPGCQR